jgi:bacteriocin biosynthesis cyclodehydratase domain-containing protein
MKLPAVKAGLLPVWRDTDTLQIGTDPRRAVAFTGLGKAAAVLSLLDGARDLEEVITTARAYGISPEATHGVLRLLDGAGVLQDFPAHLHRALPEYLRQRLAPELACASLAYGLSDGGAQVLGRRRAAHVRVYGAGRVGACIATLLATSGIAWITSRDREPARPSDLAPGGLCKTDLGSARGPAVAAAIARTAPEVNTSDDDQALPDLVVLTGTGPPDEMLIRCLMLNRIPHLAVRAAEAIGVVGPLVVPGKSACLRCIDMTKAAADPAWPRILAQSQQATPHACDTVLAAATSALASAQALAFIDGAGPEPAAANGTLELVLPNWEWRRRTWRAQPACNCGAALHT